MEHRFVRTLCQKLGGAKRSVHKRLLLMHILATLAQIAGISEYVIPVTDETCVGVRRSMLASLVLFDVRARTNECNVAVVVNTCQPKYIRYAILTTRS